jgi:tRNA modification GTPase
MNNIHDTIVALATPPMKSALAIIRLSGENSFSIVSNVFSKNLTQVKERSLHVGTITYQGELIDQVVVLQFIAPQSFTGENLIEIVIHGSPLIAQQVIEVLIAHGARAAMPGEFSSRAFLNQKIDLIQAEAIHDVIEATTLEAKRISLYALTGQTSEKINPLRIKIANLLSLIEVNIDYPEYEDIEIASKEKVITDTEAMIALANQLIGEGEKGKIIKEGMKVAIIGEPNVGKSSLLNTLINEDKAIVTNIAGTTRDVVEAELNLHGIVIRILDTAGIRESEDVVEKIGIKKSIQAIKEADLVIHMLDATSETKIENREVLDILKEKKVIEVFNKKDLIKDHDAKRLYISALKKDIEPLLNKMLEAFGLEQANYYTPSFNNSRQLGSLLSIKKHLIQAQEDAKADVTMDLISSSLNSAYEAIIQLMGLEGKVNLGDEIFSRFCVGK